MFLEVFSLSPILRNRVCSIFSIFPRVTIRRAALADTLHMAVSLPWEQKHKKEASADVNCFLSFLYPKHYTPNRAHPCPAV